MQRLLAVVIVLFLVWSADSKAQQITFGTIDPGAYGPGSNISIPISVTGFKAGNKFELWMYDSSGGSLSGGSPLGTFDGHYTTFINGVLPATVQPGTNFTVRIVASNPYVLKEIHATIAITDKNGPEIRVIPAEEKNLLKADLIYGFCDVIKDGNLLALENQSTGGAKVNVSIQDNYNASVPAESFDFPAWNLYEVPLKKSYYTASVKAELNGVISTRRYIILNTTFNLSLQSGGNPTICLKQKIDPNDHSNDENEKVTYSVNTSAGNGIVSNYPGLVYSFDWGDGMIDSFTQDELLAQSGIAVHQYKSTSCGQPPILLSTPIYNAFQANIFLSSDFCTGSSVPITTYAKVFMMPAAEFEVPVEGGCKGKMVSFMNTTIPGESPTATGDACDKMTNYKWYVKKNTDTNWSLKSKAQDLIYQFDEHGTYNIKLVASNNTCEPTEMIHDICISDLPVPDFEFTQSAPCNSATLTTVNKTSIANLCNKKYLWQVLDSVSGVVVTDGIVFLDQDTSKAPVIQVNKPGNYILRLTVSNSCDDVVLDKPFVVAGGLAVTQPSEAKICLGVPVDVDFSAETRLKPAYEGFGKNKTYQWSVSGGDYEFIDGSDTKAFPKIKFKEPGKKYTVSVAYNNECGTAVSSSQNVTFYDEIVVDAGADTVLCKNVPFTSNDTYFKLRGNKPKNYETGKWTVLPGSPVYSFENGISNTHNAKLINLKAGTYTLRWTVTNPGGCEEYDEMILKVYQVPAAGAISCAEALQPGKPASVCAGSNITLTAANSATGTLIDWQYAPDKGSLPGDADYISLGSAASSIVFNNIQQTTYFRSVVASKGKGDGCSNVAYSNLLKLPVDPLSVGGTVNSTDPTTYCEGSVFTGKIKVTDYVGTITGWEKSEDGGNIWASIAGTASAIYTYNTLLVSTLFRAVVKSGECSVAKSDPFIITVDPKPTPANAGSDAKICIDAAALWQLDGNQPLIGTGSWTQPWGQTALINNPGHYNSVISNLEKGKRYEFFWTISNGTCPGVPDQMILDVLTDISNSVKADRTISCPGEAVVLSTDALSGGDNGFIAPSYSYSWESSPDNVSWATIGGAGQETLTVYPTATTWYRRIVRSHNSCEAVSSSLKILVNATTPVANAGADLILCNSSSYKLDGNNPGAGFSGEWKELSPGGSLTFSSVSDPVATVSNFQPGNSYQLEWRIKGVAPCPDETSVVQVIVRKPVTTAVVSSPLQVCLNSAATNNFIQLTGNEPLASNGETGHWTKLSGPTAFIANPSLYNTSITGLQPGTYQFEWKIKNDATSGDAACKESAAILTVNVIAFPVKGTINGGNIAICKGTGPGTLVLSSYSMTDEIQWQSSADNVNFTDINGAVNDTYNPGALIQTMWYRVKATQASGCAGFIYSDPVKVQVDEPAEGGTTSASVSRVCIGGNAVTVSLSGEKGTVVRWEQSADNFSTWANVPVTSSNCTFHNLSTDMWFRAVVRNGACSEVYSTITHIQALPNVTAAVAGQDQYLCNETTVTLSGNSPSAGTGKWKQESGPAAVISDPLSSTTTVSALVPGTYVFRWEISNGICDASTDDVTIYNYAPLVNNITGSTTICSGQTVKAEGDAPSGGDGTYVYRWQISSDNSSWSDLPGETGKDLIRIFTVSAWVRRIVESGPCSAVSNTVFTTVQPAVTNNTIGADQVLCAGQPSSVLTGSVPLGGDGTYFYQWQRSTDGTVWNDMAGANSASLDPGTLPQTTWFRRIVTTALCSGDQKNVSNEISIVINPLPEAEVNVARLKSCVPFDLGQVISLVPHDDRNGNYEWFADGVSIGTGKTFPGYVLSHDGASVTIQLVTASKFGCGADTTKFTFETVKDVTASFTKDQVKGCGPLSVNFVNTSTPLSGGTYTWNFGNGQTSTSVHPGTMVFDPDPAGKDTTYVITLKASTGCKETVFTDSVVVRPKPLAVLSPDKTWGCSPLEISFRNQSKGGASTYTFDFGDGQTYVTNDTLSVRHTFSSAKTDTITVRLKAENECGTDTASYNIVIYPNTIVPRLIVDGDRRFGCAPLTVRFDNHTEGANRFFWDFKDGSTANTTSAPESNIHTFTVPGTYDVSLFATNGCSSATDTKTITVYALPDAGFTFNSSTYCLKDSVQFLSKLSGSASCMWNFDDGGTSTDANPRHAFARAGKYNVQLTVLQSHPDGSVCSNSTTQQVEIQPLPVALFTSNATSVNCAPFKLVVSTTPANAPYVEWEFGDPGSTDNRMTGHTAEHTFTMPGTYIVKEIAHNALGCSDTVVKSIKIQPRPAAAFSATDTMICGTSATIHFKNETAYAGTDPVAYKWLIDGRTVSVQKDMSYPFSVPSNAMLPYRYEVTLVTASTLGCPDTVKHLIQFNPIPKANFVLKSAIACAPYKIDIENKSAYADFAFWYLDGVLVSTDKDPDIILPDAGKTYTIKLKVAGKYGCVMDSLERSISTYMKPKAWFTLADSISCNGKLDIAVTNTSTGATSYTWDFGDGSPLSAQTVPQHLYGAPGVYKLRLIASNNTCSDTLTRFVFIALPPQPIFVPSVNRGCTQLNVTFQNTSLHANRYEWDFGDGTYSTESNPSHTFGYIGSPFTVRLTVTGEYGCKESAVQIVYVSAPPSARFDVLPDPVIKVPDYTFSFKNKSEGAGLKYKWYFGDGTTSEEESPVHTYTYHGPYTVKLTVTNAEGCTDFATKDLRIDGVPGFLYVPNGFEPGSSKFELKTFKPKGSGIAKYSLKVFNTWGTLIWQTDKLDETGAPAEGWDGTAGGSPAPQGVYIWEITATFLDGSEWKGMKYERGSRKTVGPVHLIR
ncbi:PKD domain-containing protein [Pararcticibacter amylolyticus]|uniref:PKD domain-containing protein n=1 Tax=Pararcticibacter amylolyticus TaxID=2173175 RepID=A0A2U2PDD8_9SPHI|nr:PKD domain-containing protein [Pararcticibacter amylolyticus]PWG79406.1 hypothetical protein DDR33_16685 [Pararcticibacter amylolyticus]